MRHDGRVQGALWTSDEGRILSWSGDNTLRLWDINWPSGNLIQVACVLLPNRNLTEVSQRYGISITEPICAPEQISLPIDWLQIQVAPLRR